MAKLCAKGKAAAKRKFKVYPSAYANMYASGVCSGKITPGGKKGSRKKAANGGLMAGMARKRRAVVRRNFAEGGLRKWVAEKWVDIGAPKKNGKYQPCGRSQRLQKEISKMRSTCKSHSDDKVAKGECCQTKKTSKQQGTKTN
jgi:hypothetical protein